ncbi:MAG: nucleotide exchange factor GrpE [Chromatiales bacterium]|nr:nucleotide exchange factor GrpE [Chromatiales bacterium]
MTAEQQSSNDKPQDSVEDAPESSQEAQADAPGEPEDELAKAKQLAEEYRDQYMRSLAELDNLRKRSERELERAHKYGVERLAGELLAVVDSLELGLEAATGEGSEAVREGMQATLKLLLGALKKFEITQIDPLGEPFNPELHEAMAAQPSADAEPDSVLLVVQKGYRIHDRTLRAARVIVARSPE